MPTPILIQLIRSRARDGLIRAMILSDCDLNEPNEAGSTPLMEAIKCVRIDIATLLINHGADIHARDNTCYRDSALSWAVYLGNTHMVRILLNLRADVNLQTRYHGNTLLLWSCKRQFYDIFILLMHRHADPTISSYAGESVFSVCDTTLFRSVLDDWKLEMSIAVHGYMDRWAQNRPFERGISKHIVSFLFP